MSEKRSVFRRALKYIAFIVIIVAAVIGLQYFFSTRQVTTYTAPLKNVRVIGTQQGSLDQSVSFPGYVMSESMVPVIPFVSGTILEYSVEAGEEVSKDQVIAQVDKKPFELQVAQAQAALDAYESSYQRLVQLQAVGAASQQELDTVRAQMQASQAQLELAQLQLSYADVTAPITGTVIMADQGVGSIANSQTPLAVIADTEDLVIEISVPEKWYNTFTGAKDSLSFSVRSLDGGASSNATLISIAPYVDPSTKTFTMKVSIDDPSVFTIGMYARVDVTYAHYEDVSLLPQSVRKSDGSMYYVEGSTARYLDGTGVVGNDSSFIVPGGYEDKLFICEGQSYVLDGESINILEDN